MLKLLNTIFIFTLLIWVFSACSGKKPQPSWTAEEYFHYAKEKYDDENYLEAVNDFTVVVLRFAGSTVADSGQFYLAMCHFNMDEFIISAAEFGKLVTDMPESPLVSEAQYMLGESYYQLSPRAELDQEYTIKALKQFQIFLEDYPKDPKKEEVEKKIFELRNKLAKKQWRNAEIYRAMRKFKAALIYYDIVLNKYYDSEYADAAQFGKIMVYFDREDWVNVKEQCLIFKDKFPNSSLMSQVEEMLKEILEKNKTEVQASTENK